MKKKIILFFSKNTLLKGSAIVMVGSVLGNFASYLFHLIMGRLLGPVDYGTLESLISITYFLGIPISVVTIIIIKFVSSHKGDKRIISSFLNKIIKKMFFFGLLGLAGFLLLFPFLKELVKTNSFILFLGVGIFSFLGIFPTIFSAFFQGIADFVKFTVISIFTSWSKLAVAIVLVLLGLRLSGAIYSIVLSTILTVVLCFFLIRKYIDLKNRDEINIRKLFDGVMSYSFSVLILNISMTSIYTADLILAKYFLSPQDAGKYAALSVLGKIIFFASSPLSSAMFPLISEKHSKGEKSDYLFWQSFLIVLGISFFVTLIYMFVPKIMINILFGKDYLDSAGYLPMFAIFISAYSLCAVFLNFYLSISKTKPVFVALGVSLLQILLIIIFHNGIGNIINVNVFIVSLLLLLLLLIYFLNGKKKFAFSNSSCL